MIRVEGALGGTIPTKVGRLTGPAGNGLPPKVGVTLAH
jgi:hypothetical protein